MQTVIGRMRCVPTLSLTPKNPRFPRGENLVPFCPAPFHFQFSIFHSLCRGLAYVDPIFVGELSTFSSCARHEAGQELCTP